MKAKNVLLIVGMFVVLQSLAVEAKELRRHRPVIAAIKSMPEGQTYGRWAVAWQQWANGVSAAVSPFTDSTGEHCSQRQVGNVWFLAGSTAGPVTRNCEIPTGKSIFFPLINTGYGAFLNDAPDTRTESYVRAAGSCTAPAQISVQIDGYNIAHPTRYFTGAQGSQSPIYNIQLPLSNFLGLHDNTPNVPGDPLEADELLLSPSAEQGYYLFVKPLSVGVHTIHWLASGCTTGNTQDITYNITVL